MGMPKFTELESTVELIVRAIQKGIGEDIREYLLTTDDATYNSLRLMRADKINTNLRDSVVSETIELKYFKRTAWIGCLLIDRMNKVTYTVCTKATLNGIPKKPNRTIPHYLQTILYFHNKEIEAPQKQVTMAELIPGMFTEFSEAEFREDYERIMDDDLSFDDGYLHLVVVYERKGFQVTSVDMRLLDKDVQTAVEYPLNYMLKPDFSELTLEEHEEPKKDVRDLVTVKAGLKKEDSSEKKTTKISAKRKEERRQA